MNSLASAGTVSFSTISVALSVFGAVIVVLAHVTSIVWLIRGMQKDIKSHEGVHAQMAKDLAEVTKNLLILGEKVQVHDVKLAVIDAKST